MELIKIQKMGGIKCDNPSCTYVNEAVTITDSPDWINRPCPLCGENLLTEKAYIAFQNMLKTIQFINKAGKIIPSSLAKKLEKKERIEGKIEFDSSGKYVITKKEAWELLFLFIKFIFLYSDEHYLKEKDKIVNHYEIYLVNYPASKVTGIDILLLSFFSKTLLKIVIKNILEHIKDKTEAGE